MLWHPKVGLPVRSTAPGHFRRAETIAFRHDRSATFTYCTRSTSGSYARVRTRTHLERRLPKSCCTQPSTHSPSPPSSESLHALKPSFHQGVTPGCELACTHLHRPTLPNTEASWTASTLASKAFWQTSGSTPRSSCPQTKIHSKVPVATERIEGRRKPAQFPCRPRSSELSVRLYQR